MTPSPAASVSVATVSKVLNGRPGVSPQTRRAVEQLLQRSGYARRGVKPIEPGSLVELVIQSLGSQWSLQIIRGVERVAREAGLTLALTSTADGIRPVSSGSTASCAANRSRSSSSSRVFQRSIAGSC